MTPPEPPTAPARPPAPATFAELLGNGGHAPRCVACAERPATHSISMHVVKLGGPQGEQVSSIRGKRVCEPCAVKLYAAVARAVRAL